MQDLVTGLKRIMGLIQQEEMVAVHLMVKVQMESL